MCQVSSSYSLCCLVMCLRVMHFISRHHVHFICIRVRLMHPSIFPVVRFSIQRSYVTRCPFLPLFDVVVLNPLVHSDTNHSLAPALFYCIRTTTIQLLHVAVVEPLSSA